MAIPDPHPIAWKILAIIRIQIFGLKAQARLDKAYMLMVVRITGFRPNLSDNGPKARPDMLIMTKKGDSVQFTYFTVVFNCS